MRDVTALLPFHTAYRSAVHGQSGYASSLHKISELIEQAKTKDFVETTTFEPKCAHSIDFIIDDFKQVSVRVWVVYEASFTQSTTWLKNLDGKLGYIELLPQKVELHVENTPIYTKQINKRYELSTLTPGTLRHRVDSNTNPEDIIQELNTLLGDYFLTSVLERTPLKQEISELVGADYSWRTSP